MNIRDLQIDEQHPLLPSGQWKGFYLYHGSSSQHSMQLYLEFVGEIVLGSGSDEEGGFTFKGSYDLEAMRVNMMKWYSTHSIQYQGNIDEQGIWGRWMPGYDPEYNMDKGQFDAIMKRMGDRFGGGFHLWPTNRREEEEEALQSAFQKYKRPSKNFPF